MTTAHKLLVSVSNLDHTETAVATATKFLLEEVPDLDVIHEAGAKTWQGDYNVQFIVSLNDSQLATVKESPTITHLETL